MLHCLKRKFVFLFQFIAYLLREIAFLFRIFCVLFPIVFVGVSVKIHKFADESIRMVVKSHHQAWHLLWVVEGQPGKRQK